MVPISKESAPQSIPNTFPPAEVVSHLLSGRGFGNTTLYSTEEWTRVRKDIQGIVHEIFSRNIEKSGKAFLAFGPSSEGKRSLMEKIAIEKEAVYLSPDYFLEKFHRTYLSDLSKMTQGEARKKWLPVAHGFSYILLKRLMEKRYPLVLNITTTFLLRRLGYFEEYQVVILNFSNLIKQEIDPSFRSIETTFPKNVTQIDFFAISDPEGSGSVWTANLVRREGEEKFTLKIIDQQRYQDLQENYNTLAKDHGWPLWKKVLEGALS